MKPRVLADTGPLYALVDPDDQHHRRARDEMSRLPGAAVLVLFPTLLETHTLILRRIGIRTAAEWLEEALRSFDLLNPGEEGYLAAVQLLRRYSDQDITLFDALLAVSSDDLSLPVWTFDHHFDVMGSQVWR